MKESSQVIRMLVPAMCSPDDVPDPSPQTPLPLRPPRLDASERALQWASTMQGAESPVAGTRTAHSGVRALEAVPRLFDRKHREAAEEEVFAPVATRSAGAGNRAIEEAPDELRTCFERDRDRILHFNGFRRLAGKTQVFIFPADHQRTRMTHALEVAQVATAIARATRLNVALAEAIALGHDCGHGPGGHASEDALSPYLDEEFDHAVWGADVVLAPLNLCVETLDGVRNHSWSRPAPSTPEGEVVGVADRIAYCAHDLEDAVASGIVNLEDLPTNVVKLCGNTRNKQLRAFINDVVTTITTQGIVGLSAQMADALGELRRFNYERIYLRDSSLAQGKAVVSLLSALVEYYAANPGDIPDNSNRPTKANAAPGLEMSPLRQAVTYVGGMTDKFACIQATDLLNWPADQMPQGLGSVG